MVYQFRPAVREQTSIILGLAGPTGSGKTYSALKIATGLSGPNAKIYGVDTEAKRMLHYADKFKFMHLDMGPPFRPENCQEAVVTAEKAGADVIIFDSISHEYSGLGGIYEWADQIGEEMGKPDAAHRWNKPKTAHKRMMGRLLNCRCHLIFCLRAEEKNLYKKTKGGKMEVISAADRPLLERWTPICEKEFMFEMTTSLMLLADRPGYPHHYKVQDQHKDFFPLDKPIDENAGRLLAEWAGSGKERPDNTEEVKKIDQAADLLKQAGQAANKGTETLRKFWNNLTPEQKKEISKEKQNLKDVAAQVDQKDMEF